jgi:hypothetical protein
MNSKYGTLEDAIQGLEMIREWMNDLLIQLEKEEDYEACIELFADIVDIEEEIKDHKRLLKLQNETGRTVSIY